MPDRSGADTQVIAHIPLSQLRQLPGAADLEDAWIRARLGEDGYLTGKDAETAACDAPTLPAVTGTMNPAVIDQMIDLARTAAEAEAGAPALAGHADTGTASPDARDGGTAEPGVRTRSQRLTPEAWRALRHAMTRLAVDLVSGPAGVAAILRRGLLDQPYNTPSLPLDIGYSDSIPWHIRRAVQLRDKKCAWPRCGRPAVYCDVHHLRHKEDGGETSVDNLILVMPVPPRRLHPPARLAADPAPRRHHRGPKPRRQTGPQIPRTPNRPSRLTPHRPGKGLWGSGVCLAMG